MLQLLPLLAIPANRLRGQEGFAGVGRFYMAVLPALPVALYNLYSAALVAVVSFAGIAMGHGKFFELTNRAMWVGMAKTGLVYTVPASLAFAAYGHYLAAAAFLLAGAAKPIAYYIAKRRQPDRDFLELAEYLFGAIIALGLLPMYFGV